MLKSPALSDVGERVCELERILLEGDIRAIYQPIVHIGTGDVVAYEALARGPAGSLLERPDELFTTAREAGLVERLDWLCRTRALEGALEAHLGPPFSLFVNVEPDTAGSRMPANYAGLWATARMVFLRLIFEVTERSVMEDPAGLLSNVANLRSFEWGVALDDVGQDPRSLAILPYVQPDVIKLDMRAVQDPDSEDVTKFVLAVNAEAERSGAMILAEGIETEEQLATAVAFGAELGQGWFFGRPDDLPLRPAQCGTQVSIRAETGKVGGVATPFEVLSSKIASRRAKKGHVLAASRLLEQRATSLPHEPMMIGCFQRDSRLTGASRGIYSRLAKELPFVAAMGIGMNPEPVPGLKGVALSPEDPLVNEWVVAMVSPYSGMILAAREIPTEGTEDDRTFALITSFDRDLVIEAAAPLLARIIRADRPEDAREDEVDFAAAISAAIAKARDAEELARPVLKLLAETLGLESTFLSKVTDETDYDIIVSHNRGDLQVEEGTHLPWSQSVCKIALEDGRRLYGDVQSQLPRAEAESYGFKTFVTVPVAVEDGKVLGTLCGASSRPDVLSQNDLDTVKALARLIGTYVEQALSE